MVTFYDVREYKYRISNKFEESCVNKKPQVGGFDI